jgi:hypothetical protein
MRPAEQGAAAALAHVRECRAIDALRAEYVDVEQAGDLLGSERLCTCQWR